MLTYGTIKSIFVEIQHSSMKIETVPYITVTTHTTDITSVYEPRHMISIYVVY